MSPEQKSSPNLASDPTFDRDMFLLQEALLTLNTTILKHHVLELKGDPHRGLDRRIALRHWASC